LAGLAYNKLDLVQDELDGWFPNKGVKLDTTMVSEYRERTNNVDSAANFKLFTVPESNLAIVSIRGTQNAFDLLADSQLWSAAMLVQVLRGILPLGEIWTPILDGKHAECDWNILLGNAARNLARSCGHIPDATALKTTLLLV